MILMQSLSEIIWSIQAQMYTLHLLGSVHKMQHTFERQKLARGLEVAVVDGGPCTQHVTQEAGDSILSETKHHESFLILTNFLETILCLVSRKHPIFISGPN